MTNSKKCRCAADEAARIAAEWQTHVDDLKRQITAYKRQIAQQEADLNEWRARTAKAEAKAQDFAEQMKKLGETALDREPGRALFSAFADVLDSHLADRPARLPVMAAALRTGAIKPD